MGLKHRILGRVLSLDKVVLTSVDIRSIYHPPCSKGVYDCENCKRKDKAQCKHDVYFCRDDLTCPNYNLNNYNCSHGGGPTCPLWCRKTKMMIEAGEGQ